MRRPFVGRERELATLVGAFDEARRRRAGFVVVLGEPGIGKTRILEELAQRVRRRARVLWGRCREGGDPAPYGPWIEIVGACAEGKTAEALRERDGTAAAELARMLPGMRSTIGEPSSTGAREPEEARRRLFRAVAALLRAASAERPLLVILDDLHRADEASLLLLAFLAREVAGTRVLIVAACRSAELRRAPGLTTLVGDLMTVGERIPLGPLPVSEVSDLIAAVSGTSVSAPVAAAIHERTAGNPLFVYEVTRLLAAEGTLTSPDAPCWRIPEGVRAVIRHHLATLSAASREALAAAAVVGRDFSVEVLAAICGFPVDRALALLDEAETLGVIQRTPDAPDRRRFFHVLVRDVLYEDLRADDRARLHSRAGGRIAELFASDLDPHLPSLAYHFLQAGALGDLERAVFYSTKAGDRALAQLAYEEAVGHYDAALEVLSRSARDDPAGRTALLLARGEAERSAGDRAAARRSFREAAAVARMRGAGVDLARAALGFTGTWIHQLMIDPENVELLESALERVGTEAPTLRARLLARLAMELYYTPEVARCLALGAEGVRIARTVDDPETLAFALHAYNWACWRPDRLSERRAITAEMVAAAERSGSPELLAESLAWRVRAELDAGDIRTVDTAIALHARLARQTRRPLDLWRSLQWRVTRASLAGRFAEAERLLPEALAAAMVAAERSQYFLAPLYYAWDVHCLRREQGRAEEVLGEIGHLVEPFAALQSVRLSLGDTYLAIGRRDEARAILEDFAATAFATMPYDVTWLRDTTMLAHLAVELEDVPRASVLYERLRPHAGVHVALGAIGYMGPLDRHLGRLAVVLGRLDEAVAHLEAALAACREVGARPQLARTQSELAAVLRRRGSGGDQVRAEALREAATRAASGLGMAGLVAELAAVQPPAVSAPGARSRAHEATFRRDGTVWTLTFGGMTIRLPDSKGLRQIARLLAAPRTPLHCLELAQDEPGEVAPAPRSDGGALLDARARAAYRGRLRDLRLEADEARRLGDLGALQRAQVEMEALSGELARAFGVSGRYRRAGSTSERARVAVVRTIGRAIARIAAVHPSLGHHLRTTISTGTACLYDPGPGREIRWAR